MTKEQDPTYLSQFMRPVTPIAHDNPLNQPHTIPGTPHITRGITEAELNFENPEAFILSPEQKAMQHLAKISKAVPRRSIFRRKKTDAVIINWQDLGNGRDALAFVKAAQQSGFKVYKAKQKGKKIIYVARPRFDKLANRMEGLQPMEKIIYNEYFDSYTWASKLAEKVSKLTVSQKLKYRSYQTAKIIQHIPRFARDLVPVLRHMSRERKKAEVIGHYEQINDILGLRDFFNLYWKYDYEADGLVVSRFLRTQSDKVLKYEIKTQHGEQVVRNIKDEEVVNYIQNHTRLTTSFKDAINPLRIGRYVRSIGDITEILLTFGAAYYGTKELLINLAKGTTASLEVLSTANVVRGVNWLRFPAVRVTEELYKTFIAREQSIAGFFLGLGIGTGVSIITMGASSEASAVLGKATMTSLSNGNLGNLNQKQSELLVQTAIWAGRRGTVTAMPLIAARIANPLIVAACRRNLISERTAVNLTSSILGNAASIRSIALWGQFVGLDQESEILEKLGVKSPAEVRKEVFGEHNRPSTGLFLSDEEVEPETSIADLDIINIGGIDYAVTNDEGDSTFELKNPEDLTQTLGYYIYDSNSKLYIINTSKGGQVAYHYNNLGVEEFIDDTYRINDLANDIMSPDVIPEPQPEVDATEVQPTVTADSEVASTENVAADYWTVGGQIDNYIRYNSNGGITESIVIKIGPGNYDQLVLYVQNNKIIETNWNALDFNLKQALISIDYSEEGELPTIEGVNTPPEPPALENPDTGVTTKPVLNENGEWTYPGFSVQPPLTFGPGGVYNIPEYDENTNQWVIQSSLFSMLGQIEGVTVTPIDSSSEQTTELLIQSIPVDSNEDGITDYLQYQLSDKPIVANGVEVTISDPTEWITQYGSFNFERANALNISSLLLAEMGNTEESFAAFSTRYGLINLDYVMQIADESERENVKINLANSLSAQIMQGNPFAGDTNYSTILFDINTINSLKDSFAWGIRITQGTALSYIDGTALTFEEVEQLRASGELPELVRYNSDNKYISVTKADGSTVEVKWEYNPSYQQLTGFNFTNPYNGSVRFFNITSTQP